MPKKVNPKKEALNRLLRQLLVQATGLWATKAPAAERYREFAVFLRQVADEAEALAEPGTN